MSTRFFSEHPDNRDISIDEKSPVSFRYDATDDALWVIYADGHEELVSEQTPKRRNRKAKPFRIMPHISLVSILTGIGIGVVADLGLVLFTIVSR